jgi:predicted ATPase
MANANQPDRWEASLLAAAMAVVGAPFLFDKLASLVNSGVITLSMALHAAPVLLAVAGAIILLTDPSGVAATSDSRKTKGDQHEL